MPVGAPDANGNLIGGSVSGVIDPLLAPLAENGGQSLNYALLAGSPALDAGDPSAVAGVGGVPEFDQRSSPFVRVFGGAIDIGAYERTAVLVSTLVDENDIDHSFGDFSLREAIEFVNASLPDLSDAIRFDESIWGGTILLTQGQLNIDALGTRATIEGPGANLMTIDASGNDPTPDTDNGDGSRVFQTGGEVEIIGVTLTGGDTPFVGGAIWAGGAISDSHLTLTRSTISGNVSSYQAGGIAAYVDVTIIDSTITGNSAGVLLGSSGHGGAISLGETGPLHLIIINSTISGNSTSSFGDGGGGGIADSFITSNYITISNSTISGNSTGGKGGGINSAGKVTVTNSTISGNSSNGVGGGITVTADGSLMVTNSTITGNRADADDMGGGAGGGIFGDAVLVDSIVAGNFRRTTASSRDDIAGHVEASNSLIGVDSALTVTDNGGNLIGTFASPIDPLLGPLADNGGLTLTHALLFGSPAIDAGSLLLVTPSNVDSSTDGSDIGDSSQLNDDSGLSDTPTGVNYTTVTHALADEENAWFTADPGGPGSDYYNFGSTPELTFDFGEALSLTDLVVWGFSDGGPNNNEAKSFTVEFSTDGGGSYYDSVQVTHARTGVNQETISFGGAYLANYVRITITDNHFGTPGGTGGERVGLGEVKFLSGQGFDQRGEGFPRISGGRIDMGAFEFQYQPPELLGDYNQNGTVDAADYVVWRKTLGTGGVSAFSAPMATATAPSTMTITACGGRILGRRCRWRGRGAVRWRTPKPSSQTLTRSIARDLSQRERW